MAGAPIRLEGVKAFLFDFDNTLVDSNSVLGVVHRKTAEAISSYLTLMGYHVALDEIAEIIRHVVEEMEDKLILDRNLYWIHVLRRLGVHDGPENLLSRWTDVYWRYYSTAKVFTDVEPVLSRLASKYRLGLVTNTDGRSGLKRRRLEMYDIMRFFEVVVVAGDDVEEVKPSPRPFLRAAEMLDLGPGECVMVGDHPRNDVAGAKAAGMAAVLLARRGKGSYAGNLAADFVIESLFELLLII